MGLKPPPRELVVTAGQVTGSVGRWRGLAGQPSTGATEPGDAVDVAENEACQVQVGVVAVTVTGRIALPW